MLLPNLIPDSSIRPNAWCFGCNKAATIGNGEQMRQCGGSNCNGMVRRVANQAALEVGLLAHRLGLGAYAQAAILLAASRADVDSLMRQLQSSNVVDNRVDRLDGTHHVFDLKHFLEFANSDADTRQELQFVWLRGAYLTLADALQTRGQYFDHAPELELVYHLRNGLGHGNRFLFDNRARRRLSKYPAHNRFCRVRGTTDLVITPALHGQTVVSPFAKPADLLDVLFSVEIYLKEKGVGEGPRS